MHQAMSQRMVRAKILFYDSNPIGRILTRFSKDMVVLDLIVPNSAVLISYGLFRTISVVISLCIINVWLMIPLVFIVVYFIQQVRSVAKPLVEAQRMDSTVRGPIHSLFAMVVNGLVSIRAYDKIDFFKEQFMNEAELSANVTFTYIVTSRWLAFRLDIGILLMSIAASVSCIVLKGQIDSELLSFSLQIITDFAIFFSISVRLITMM